MEIGEIQKRIKFPMGELSNLELQRRRLIELSDAIQVFGEGECW